MPKELLDVFPTRRNQKIADETDICNTRRTTRLSAVGELYTYCTYAGTVVVYQNPKRAPKPPRISYSPDPKPARPRAKSVRPAIVAPLSVPPVPLNPVQHVSSNAIQQIQLNSLQPVQLQFQPNKPKTARQKSQSVPPKSLQSKPVQPKPVQPKLVPPKLVPPRLVPPKSVQPKSLQSKPVQPKSVQSKPVQPKSVRSKSVQPKSVQPKLVPPKSVPPKSVQPKSVQPKLVPPKSVPPKSVQPKSVQPKPVQPKSVRSKPVQPKSVQSKPVQPKSVRSKSVQPKSVQPKPMQPKPVQPKSVQQKPMQNKQIRSKSFRQTSVNTNPCSQNAAQPNSPRQKRSPRKPLQLNNSVPQRTIQLRSARENSIPRKPLLLKSILKKTVPSNSIWTRQNSFISRPIQPKYTSVPPRTIRFKLPLQSSTPPRPIMKIDSSERKPIRQQSLPPKSILQNTVQPNEVPVNRQPKTATRPVRSQSELSACSDTSAPPRTGLKRAASCSQSLQTKRLKQQEEEVVSIRSSPNKSPIPFSDDELDDEVFSPSSLPAPAHHSINTTGLSASNTSERFEDVTFDDIFIKEEEPDSGYEPIIKNPGNPCDDGFYEVFTINDVDHEIVVSNDCKDAKSVYHLNGIYDVDDVDKAYDIDEIKRIKTADIVNKLEDTNDVNEFNRVNDAYDVNTANAVNDVLDFDMADNANVANHFNAFNDVNDFNDLMDVNDFNNVNFFNDSNKVNGVDVANVVKDGYDFNGIEVFHDANVPKDVNLVNDFKNMNDANNVEDPPGGNIGDVVNDAYDVSIGALYSSESALPVFANGKVAIEYDNFDFSVSCALIRNLRCFDENHEGSLIPLLKLADREIINKLCESTVEDFYVREFVPAFDNMKKYQEEPTKFVNSNEGQFERYVEDGRVIEVPLPPKPELFPYQIDKRSKAEIVKETNKKIESEWQNEVNERQRIAEEWINQQAELEHERFINYHMELDQDFQRQMLNNPPLINMFPVPYPELNPNNFPFYPQFPPIPQNPFVIPPLDLNYYNIYPPNMPPPFNPNFHM
ncbi:hypothetical protein GCK72_014910 [Caenorhabditis remanei]|uniref:Uncharacterized protein n=1 Tax=Caenorhabditis remanei TaxID=31234 RepID=A0A6A5GVQ5_CAERE|nr:hypothetical protein GCK72_014910 [Caenorhabditis remanei]KAF1758452.1 hypothetical protein GCK72_014910 [Caenorhabditis remanei]